MHPKASFYLSLDFWSQQRKELTDKNLYVIRLGRGSFGIFDQTVYRKPYLELSTQNAEELTPKTRPGFRNMKKAFRIVDNQLVSAENTLLGLCRVYDVFNQVIELFNEKGYQIGPRGLFTSSFPLFFKRRTGELTEFSYQGQVELDYSIWTESRVFVIEAKSMARSGLDIGWHKLAFPSQRFSSQTIEDGLKINPLYFLRTRHGAENVVFIFIFPEISFMGGGVVLNDEGAWEPIKVFRLDLDDLELG